MKHQTDIVGCGWTFPPKIGAQGGVLLTCADNEIEESITIILMTSPGQRVMRPNFGCLIHELVFAPNNVHTAAIARRYVDDALAMWEPRITVTNVIARPHNIQQNWLFVEIEYVIKATNDPRSLVFPFYLIPEE